MSGRAEVLNIYRTSVYFFYLVQFLFNVVKTILWSWWVNRENLLVAEETMYGMISIIHNLRHERPCFEKETGKTNSDSEWVALRSDFF